MLTPAPWEFANITNPEIVHDGKRIMDTICSEFPDDEEDLAFTALARNAFDVMMRRGWTAKAEWSNHGELIIDGWHVVDHIGRRIKDDLVTYPSPFMALVEVDKCYGSES